MVSTSWPLASLLDFLCCWGGNLSDSELHQDYLIGYSIPLDFYEWSLLRFSLSNHLFLIFAHKFYWCSNKYDLRGSWWYSMEPKFLNKTYYFDWLPYYHKRYTLFNRSKIISVRLFFPCYKNEDDHLFNFFTSLKFHLTGNDIA